MKRATSQPARLLARLVPLGFAAIVLAPTFASGVGGAALLGCQPCNARVVAVDVSPPEPCLKVTPTVCNLGSEGLRIDNQCLDALSLTSTYFLAEGTLGNEGGTGSSTYVIASDNFANFVAGPNAVGQNVLSLYGTLGGTPVTIIIGVELVGPDGAVVEGGADSSLVSTDANVVRKDAGKDGGKDAAKDAGHDAKADASKDAGKDAAKDAPHDASSHEDATDDGAADAFVSDGSTVTDAASASSDAHD